MASPRAVFEDANGDLWWDALTWRQQEIMRQLARGDGVMGRWGVALAPLERAGLIRSFKRDFLLRKASPTVWRLTDQGRALVLAQS